MSRLTRLALVLALAILAFPLHADFAGDFKNGVTAFDRKRWPEAVRLMRAAIAQNPRESSQKILIYGTRYVEYTPYLYLAVAASRVNDCATVRSAFESSQQQGVGARLPIYREAQAAEAACPRSAAPEIQPPTDTVAPPITTTTTTVSPIRPEPIPVDPPRPRPNPRDQARPPLPITQTTASVPPPAPVPVPQPQPLTPPDPSPASAGVLDRRIADAVRAYIRGDYGRVIVLLDGARFSGGLSQSQAALFRAAARYALYVVGGGTDATLRNAAAVDVREYRRLSSDAPDARVFAPPFRRFYTEVVR